MASHRRCSAVRGTTSMRLERLPRWLLHRRPACHRRERMFWDWPATRACSSRRVESVPDWEQCQRGGLRQSATCMDWHSAPCGGCGLVGGGSAGPGRLTSWRPRNGPSLPPPPLYYDAARRHLDSAAMPQNMCGGASVQACDTACNTRPCARCARPHGRYVHSPAGIRESNCESWRQCRYDSIPTFIRQKRMTRCPVPDPA